MSFLETKRGLRRKNPPASLRKQCEFRRVYKNGKSAAMPLFVVYAAGNNLGRVRLGISASRKVGNAIVRNRVRRLARESCRLMFAEKAEENGFDIIVIARSRSGELPRDGAFASVSATLGTLFKRLGVFA